MGLGAHTNELLLQYLKQAHNKLGYQDGVRALVVNCLGFYGCHALLLFQCSYLSTFCKKHCKYRCKTVITREFIMNFALVNFLVVNRVIVLYIYLFVA